MQEFYAGIDLVRLRQQILSVERRQEHVGYHFLSDIMLLLRSVIACMGRQTTSPTVIEQEGQSESALFKAMEADSSRFALGYYWTFKAQVLYLHDDYAAAEEAAANGARELRPAGQFVLVANRFYHLLAHISQCEHDAAGGRQLDSALWTSGMVDMERWAEAAPMNCRHYALTLRGERARVAGEPWRAVTIYRQALKDAQTQGFVQDEGIIHERLARLWQAMEAHEYARPHLEQARAAFASWGSETKAAALAQELAAQPDGSTTKGSPYDSRGRARGNHLAGHLGRHRGGAAAIAESSATHGAGVETHIAKGTLRGESGDLAEQLELATVLKASNAIAGQLVLDDLSRRLLQVTLEGAGAERGCLLRPRSHEAISDVASDAVSDAEWYVEMAGEMTPTFASRVIGKRLRDI